MNLRVAASLLLLLPCFGAHAAEMDRAGYWEGSGRATQTPMHDEARTLTRTAKFDFWFVVSADGSAVGEADIDYDATLTVADLPHVNAGFVEFAPNVGGKLADPDPHRRFAIAGVMKEDQLVLDLVPDEKDRKPLKFVIRAEANVGANIGVGSSWDAAGGHAGRDAIEIPMVPFSPFVLSASPFATISRRPDGPFVADYERTSDEFTIRWSAKRIEDRKRDAAASDEAHQLIQQMRQQLGL